MTIDDEKLRLWLDAAVVSAFRAGAAEERASVVAWLRDETPCLDTCCKRVVLDLAGDIERGEHRREEGK